MKLSSGDKKWLLITAVLAIILASIGFMINHKQANQYRELSAQATSWNNKLTAKQNRIDRAALTKGHATSNYQDSVVEVNDLDQVRDDANSLFKILTNYKNSEEYNERKDLSSKYLTSPILKSKYLFASDKDEDGNSIIDAEGLVSSFVSVQVSVDPTNKQEVWIKSTWDSNYSDKPTAVHREVDIYKAHYNYSMGKFTKLDMTSVLDTYDLRK